MKWIWFLGFEDHASEREHCTAVTGHCVTRTAVRPETEEPFACFQSFSVSEVGGKEVKDYASEDRRNSKMRFRKDRLAPSFTKAND